MTLPRLYAIVDAATCARRGVEPVAMARELADAGVRLLQYRDKVNGPAEVVRVTRAIAEVFADEPEALLVMNDRADLAVLAGWRAVHVGQGDLPAVDALRVMGEGALVGVSTHTPEQVRAANAMAAAYVAVGPVFGTQTKVDAEPVIGLDGVRAARALTTKPVVAIGGITLETATGVIAAGADAVAVISGLFLPGMGVRAAAEQWLRVLGR